MTWKPGIPVARATERFELRSLEDRDATDRYGGWLRDPEVMRFVNARFTQHDLPSVRDFIASHDNRTRFLLGIFTRADGLHIGNLKADIDVDGGDAAIGVLVGGFWTLNNWKYAEGLDIPTLGMPVLIFLLGLNYLVKGLRGER